ncbi:hypothetical protein T4C_13721 [Trichinella pseudospiralis]|uniref:Uncharacterized protein n=1 Tax=Trichinella pseudospiralis TaxID=6337 RepID=A0A0V1GUF7_TRIPS|nr:hypothetical protein T4C_13721 [Trichinella pseudospiralis]
MQITIAVKRCETFSEFTIAGTSCRIPFCSTCITIIQNGAYLYGKVNEAKKGENANDTKQITDGI